MTSSLRHLIVLLTSIDVVLQFKCRECRGKLVIFIHDVKLTSLNNCSNIHVVLHVVRCVSVNLSEKGSEQPQNSSYTKYIVESGVSPVPEVGTKLVTQHGAV